MHSSTQDDHRGVTAGWQNRSVCLQQTDAKTPRSTRKRTGQLSFFIRNHHLCANNSLQHRQKPWLRFLPSFPSLSAVSPFMSPTPPWTHNHWLFLHPYLTIRDLSFGNVQSWHCLNSFPYHNPHCSRTFFELAFSQTSHSQWMLMNKGR